MAAFHLPDQDKTTPDLCLRQASQDVITLHLDLNHCLTVCTQKKPGKFAVDFLPPFPIKPLGIADLPAWLLLPCQQR